MDEFLIIKVVFGMLLSVGGFVLIFLAFKLYYKYLIQENKCSVKTKGVIKKYTLTARGKEECQVHLPVVFYNVDGKEYKVTGPEYRSYKIVFRKDPLEKNNVKCDEKNQTLLIERTTNSLIGVYKNPIKELYPIGSKIDVYYNPKNPKISYVLRYCNKKWAFWLLLISGIAILIIDLIILIVL